MVNNPYDLSSGKKGYNYLLACRKINQYNRNINQARAYFANQPLNSKDKIAMVQSIRKNQEKVLDLEAMIYQAHKIY